MATNISTLKSYFETGDKPTQAQFYAWLDSFRHKDDKIALTDLSTELQNFLNGVGGKSFVVLTPGQASYAPAAGELIEVIVFDDDANPNVKVGTTNGGSEIAAELQLVNGEFLFEQKLRFKTAGSTIYFGNITGNTVTTIYKR